MQIEEHFFLENISNEIESRGNKDSIISTRYVDLLLPNHKLFLSKLVGHIYLSQGIIEGKEYDSGTNVFFIRILNVDYTVFLEETCLIKKIYVIGEEIVMYNSPLLLVEQIQ